MAIKGFKIEAAAQTGVMVLVLGTREDGRRHFFFLLSQDATKWRVALWIR
jgi:hypothetical protein